MYLTESEIALDTQAMADNLMACIKSLAEVDRHLKGVLNVKADWDSRRLLNSKEWQLNTVVFEMLRCNTLVVELMRDADCSF